MNRQTRDRLSTAWLSTCMAEPPLCPTSPPAVAIDSAHLNGRAARGQFRPLCCRPAANCDTHPLPSAPNHLASSSPASPVQPVQPSQSSQPASRPPTSRPINRALCYAIPSVRQPLSCIQLALFHLMEGYSYRRLPRQPSCFTISAPRPVPITIATQRLQPTFSLF